MENRKWIFDRRIETPESTSGFRIETELVDLEKWIWAVLYRDGTELHQFDDLGIFHQIGEVDQAKVRMFSLYEPHGKGRIDLIVPEGAKLVHKYKWYVFDAATPHESRKKVYVFGYKLGNDTHLSFVKPDNTIIQTINNNNPKLSELGI